MATALFVRSIRLIGCLGVLSLLVGSDGWCANGSDAVPMAKGNSTPVGKAVVEIGFYPMNIFDLDPGSRTFKADFYVWMIYRNNLDGSYLEPDRDGVKYPSVERLEAENGKDLTFERQEYELKGHPELKMVWYRLRGTFFHDFSLRRYPFDRHELKVKLESPIWPAEDLTYKMSTYRNGNNVDKEKEFASFGEWTVESIQHFIDIHEYVTDWGRPGDKVPNQYSRNIVTITLVRSATLPLLRLLIPLLASAIVASIILFMKFDKSSTAVQLCIAMFLSVVGQHHAFLTTMSAIGGVMYANSFFLLTYLYVASLTIIAATIGVCVEGQEEAAGLVRFRRLLPLLYTLSMALILLLLLIVRWSGGSA